MLALTMVPGLGPIRIAKLIEALGSPEAVLGATTSQFARVPGIGNTTAASIAQHLHRSIERVDEALEKIAKVGAHVVSIGDPQYPPMLAQTPSAPPILMVRGRLDHSATHKYTVSIVGSRSCSVYGSEQATRFGHAFASAGLTVVSGGARGIDTCAHRGALSGGGSTIVVMGCGLAHAYPPENANLFDEVVATGGAIISELPVHTPPDAKNFPARNRIISGLSLGVVVIEAGLKSGALITARHANEDHGREVMGVPGRIDSPASAGSNQLLKDGAHLVTDPSDVISILERDAYHLYSGSHEAKTKDPTSSTAQPALFEKPTPNTSTLPPAPTPIGDVDDATRALLEALDEPRTGDELAERLGLNPGDLRSKLTMLEIQGRVQRAGSRFKRVR
tara:strand:+ start:56505 stop:57680 length:1176 start_codon:yes stop_codon:yes gene_type:complete